MYVQLNVKLPTNGVVESYAAGQEVGILAAARAGRGSVPLPMPSRLLIAVQERIHARTARLSRLRGLMWPSA